MPETSVQPLSALRELVPGASADNQTFVGTRLPVDLNDLVVGTELPVYTAALGSSDGVLLNFYHFCMDLFIL